jgi:acyl-ACP thioesterase
VGRSFFKPHSFPSKAIKRLKEGEHTAAITARRADLDINGHVNNVHYTEFCMEAVPHEFIEAHACVGIDIQFRSESFAGDSYTAACTCIENENGRQSMLHSLTRMTDGKEIVRMQTWWIEK